jgi:hypothetical protein
LLTAVRKSLGDSRKKIIEVEHREKSLWLTIWPIATLALYFLVGLLGAYLNAQYIWVARASVANGRREPELAADLVRELLVVHL